MDYYPGSTPIAGPDGLPIDPKGDADLQQALSIELALALDGHIFAMLTLAELELFKFYRDQGRKYGVVATVVNTADPAELAEAKSQAYQDEIMRRVNSTVSVVRC
ncbi:hypothetical protein HZF02_23835 [Pseudomonas yamanorum]|nr:hypothetical protein HZF02_23835 [Pseudomonas yamanorum]